MQKSLLLSFFFPHNSPFIYLERKLYCVLYENKSAAIIYFLTVLEISLSVRSKVWKRLWSITEC